VLGIPGSGFGSKRDERAPVQSGVEPTVQVEEVSLEERHACAPPPNKWAIRHPFGGHAPLSEERLARYRRDLDADDIEAVRSEPGKVGRLPGQGHQDPAPRRNAERGPVCFE
jgi:hypothetical protein